MSQQIVTWDETWAICEFETHLGTIYGYDRFDPDKYYWDWSLGVIDGSDAVRDPDGRITFCVRKFESGDLGTAPNRELAVRKLIDAHSAICPHELTDIRRFNERTA